MLRSRSIAKVLVTLFFIQSCPIQAWANDKSSVLTSAVVGLRSGNNSQEDKIRQVLSDGLVSKDFQVLQESAVTSKLQEYSASKIDPKSEASVKSAYEHFNAGQQFYWKLDLTNALKEFNLAVRGYREGISTLRDNYYLLFSHLYLGITLHFLGRMDEGKKFIEQMVLLDQERKTRVLPQRDFPPKIVTLHKQILQEILAKPMSLLSVDSVPQGAQVIFDGSEVGKTPLQIKAIPSGQHFLALDLVGYQFYGSPIEVNPGQQNFITTLKEKNIFRLYDDNMQTESAKTELKQIADSMGVDLLILGKASALKGSSIDVQTQVFDARFSEFSEIYDETLNMKKPKFLVIPAKIKGDATASVIAPEPSPVLEAIKQRKESQAKIAMPDENSSISEFDKGESAQTIGDSSKPFYKKWWFWGVVGVVAVSAGASVLFLGGSSSDSNILTITNPL